MGGLPILGMVEFYADKIPAVNASRYVLLKFRSPPNSDPDFSALHPRRRLTPGNADAIVPVERAEVLEFRYDVIE